jgi:hypothetical protein
MRQTAFLRYCIGGLIGIAAFAGGFVGQAYAHPTARYLHRSTSIRVTHRTVLGHPVRVCSWRPGDRRVRGLVRYSRTHLLTVPGWAGAGRKRSRAACALNGGTYRTASPNRYRPSGTVFAQGRRIRRVMDAPAVGFLPGGRVIFGAQAARQHGSGNIMNGLAMLVEHGRPLLRHSDAVWTTPAQFACGAPGTDGVYGCSRSAVVQFKNGRVGLVEVLHASMPAAAIILKQMGARAAITFDSGGAAGMWTLIGRHNLSRTQVGRYVGATMGTNWHRHIPDAIVMNARKL